MHLIQGEYEKIKDKMQPGDVIAFSGSRPISAVIKLATSSHVSHVGIIIPPDSRRDDDSDEVPVIAEATEDGIKTRALSECYRDNAVEKLWWLRLKPDFALEGFHRYLHRYGQRPYDYFQAAMLGLMLLQPTLDTIDPELDDSIRQLIVDNLNRGSASDNQEKRRNIRQSLLRTIATRTNDMTGNHVPNSLIRTVFADDTSKNLLDQNDSEEDYENFFCSEFVAGALSAGGVIDGINPTQVTPIELCRFHLYEDDYTQFKGEEARIRGFNCVDPSRWKE